MQNYNNLTKVQKLVILQWISQSMLSIEILMNGSMVVDDEIKIAEDFCKQLNKNLLTGEFINLAENLLTQIKTSP